MVEYANIPFGPQSGGYASVFFGWTALYVVATLLALYRLETAFAARPPPSRHAERCRRASRPRRTYWALLAGIGILAWIVLYLV